MYTLRIETEFAAAHFLRHYRGKCENLHGHNYRVRLWIRGEELDEGGMLADFGLLRQVLLEVTEPLDHSSLNEQEVFQDDPSAERIARYIYEKLKEIFPRVSLDPRLLWAVEVYENQGSMARYEVSPALPKR